MSEQNLKIFLNMYDFALWMLSHTAKFPKSSRFSVSVRIENLVLDMLEGIIIANRRQKKEEKLLEIDENLERLRILIRLSKDMKFLSPKSYEYAAKQLSEAGRMLGGWIKQQKIAVVEN